LGRGRGAFDPLSGVAYDFCVGRGAQYPIAFLKDWSGTLVRDEYKAYESVLKLHDRQAAGCLAHARRKYDELLKDNKSPVATQAIQRIAWIYRIERELRDLNTQDRLDQRQARTKPLWEEMFAWLTLERERVPDGSGTARALDYSLNHWNALSANLRDGDVPVDNNHLENLMRPWAMGRKAWLFCGSELAGKRAAVVMSLVMSAKLNGHDPWAYLTDVLTKLPTYPNSRIQELLPHLWQPQP
jgi:transposase